MSEITRTSEGRLHRTVDGHLIDADHRQVLSSIEFDVARLAVLYADALSQILDSNAAAPSEISSEHFMRVLAGRRPDSNQSIYGAQRHRRGRSFHAHAAARHAAPRHEGLRIARRASTRPGEGEMAADAAPNLLLAAGGFSPRPRHLRWLDLFGATAAADIGPLAGESHEHRYRSWRLCRGCAGAG